MNRKMLVILLAGALPCVGFAAEKAKPAAAARPAYSQPAASSDIPDTDSCGLGWQVTQKKTLSATTTRGTTNAFVPPTFGMTTGTIGCSQHPLSKKDQEAVKYAYNNFDALSIEMAEGQGEFLKSFAQTMGCGDASFDAFSKMTQGRYRAIMNGGNANSVQMFENVKNELKQDAVLSISCNAV